MAIQWNQLTSIQPPSVIAQLPATPPSDGLNSLAGGIMQGLQQGSAIQTQGVMRDQARQQMEQNAKLFPSQLANQEAITKHNQTIVQQDLRSESGIAAYRQNVSKSYDDAIKAMGAIDPVGAVKMQQEQADLQKKQADAASAMSDSRTKQTALLPQLQITVSNLVSDSINLSTQEDPKTGQPVTDWNKANQVYQQKLEPVRKTTPDLLPAFPEKLDQGSAINVMSSGQMAHAEIAAQGLAKNPKDNSTPDMKNSKRLAELDVKEKKGTITEEEAAEKSRLEATTVNKESSPQLAKVQSLVDDLQSQYDKLKDKSTPGARRILQKLQEAKAAVAKETNPGLIQGAVNKVADFVGLGESSPASPSSNVTSPPSQEDIEFTAKKYNMTPEQVKKKLGIQ